MKHTAILTFLVFCLGLVSLSSAQASETSWKSADYVQARLISAARTLSTASQFEAALEVRLSDDWYSYWRMPGEGGLASVFD